MIVVQCRSCGAKLPAPRPKSDGTADCPRCGEPLTVPTDAGTAETVAVPPHAPELDRTLTLGTGETATGTSSALGPISIPGYEVLEELGRGGMGIVYKARQFNPPRLVALKMILAGEHADPDHLARFRNEAETVARLTHPAIAQIHQVGEWHPAGGGPSVPFLTLEYVPGQTLSRRLTSGPPLPAAQAAALIRQLAEGVHYAHLQGVVHRDLKPGNILLVSAERGVRSAEPKSEDERTSDSPHSALRTPRSAQDAKIVDFGLAKSLDGFASTVSEGPHTRTGAVMGTPNYMAPEQAAGKGEAVGPAADVYALGAILYECLTGRPPFEGESALETLLQVTRDDPEPPRGINPTVPRDLETVCLTCLAKDPTRRYPSASALAADLGRFLAGEPVNVRPPGRIERFGRWARRRKEVVYLAGGALLAGVIVLSVVLFAPTPEPEIRPPVPNDPPVARPEPAGVSQVAEARLRMTTSNNLKILGVGLHNFLSAYGTFPPAASCDKDGKPLLSWRVAILPYIEEDNLYKQFKLDEPWDGPNNKKLIDKMPRVYAVEGKSAGPPSTTHYQAIVGPGTAWEVLPELGGPFGRRGVPIQSFTDGTSNTILLAEGAEPVIWSKPEDLVFDGKQLPKFGGVIQNGYAVVLADGSVRIVSGARPQDVRAALTRNGGELPLPDWDAPAPARATGPGELRGRVTLNGKVIRGAKIVVTAEGGKAGPAVPVLADGSYSLTLPPGEYRVSFAPGTPPKDKPGESVLYEVPQRYTDPATSGLAVTVKPGVQARDFILTAEGAKK